MGNWIYGFAGYPDCDFNAFVFFLVSTEEGGLGASPSLALSLSHTHILNDSMMTVIYVLLGCSLNYDFVSQLAPLLLISLSTFHVYKPRVRIMLP